MDAVERELIGNTDAETWAREFVKMVQANPAIPTDEGTMLGWFANAIMAGHDEGRKIERQRGFHDVVREIAFQAAGAGSGAVMQEAPDVVMPDGPITESVNRILAEFGVEGYGRTGTSCATASLSGAESWAQSPFGAVEADYDKS